MKIIPGRLRFFFEYFFLYQGNLINYLRKQGVNIGYECQLFNQPENFGSEPWLIEIGNRVTITAGVFLLTHDASSRLFRENYPDSSVYGNRFGKVKIRDNCFIGINSIILPNVTIGPNSIIGAGSVVVKDVTENSVYAGVPAKKIATLDEYIEKYQERKIPIESTTRNELRSELTKYFWGEKR